MKRMDIIVTTHAVERYRERLFDYKSSDERIVKTLEEAARRGKTVAIRPHSDKTCSEVKYHGLAIVQIDQGDIVLVITCLGDERFRKWANTRGNDHRVPQSLLYPEVIWMGTGYGGRGHFPIKPRSRRMPQTAGKASSSLNRSGGIASAPERRGVVV